MSSVGIVSPQSHYFDQPIDLACGRTLPAYELVYETYGQLNADASNAVLICHALSGHHHAAGRHHPDDKHPGWWDAYIGPGKPIDTNKFFVVSLNNIGGCHGSTGPTSINPDTGKPWGADFPPLRCRDWVNTQYRLMQLLHIEQWAAVIGGSLGGMQAMRWSLMYPECVRHCVVIASAMKLSTQNIAFNEVARQAILSDPEFHDGHYLEHNTLPKQGLRLARMVGHITYLSEDGMKEKFGRELKTGSLDLGHSDEAEFQIESYLRYQGDSFSTAFDANSYILMTKALDMFDLANDYGDDPVAAFKGALCDYLIVSFTTDWRFSPQRSREIVNAMIAAHKPVSYAEIDANFGHDAFLIPHSRYETVLRNYLQRIVKENEDKSCA
ncbi:homoserine O-acetyltransferase [Dasania sp. GY-MA-18]|uniref:Homoserine O-succinyltransferase n=1 Tax=Dasania phycosphaerae TaxID=2950436 RepID=A0A9J6RLM9_9GAMM|nr:MULTISPECIES: homoserine O-acetyltransferase [Dasania]MCR8922473.1 homoserine O-acetyltransferase [Dasania sp. GY-MA-18]MCZ0864901.1 homoserine O-acetyltransferase [Dasania phycosphaerae]MCZ0868629.1 homoserine O-acetyltransferase [Dasania phycosphaerae]